MLAGVVSVVAVAVYNDDNAFRSYNIIRGRVIVKMHLQCRRIHLLMVKLHQTGDDKGGFSSSKNGIG